MFICVRSASGTFLQYLGASVRETGDIGRAHRFSSAEEALASCKDFPGFWSVVAAPEASQVATPQKEEKEGR